MPSPVHGHGPAVRLPTGDTAGLLTAAWLSVGHCQGQMAGAHQTEPPRAARSHSRQSSLRLFVITATSSDATRRLFRAHVGQGKDRTRRVL